jgi:hypothetical protein
LELEEMVGVQLVIVEEVMDHLLYFQQSQVQVEEEVEVAEDQQTQIIQEILVDQVEDLLMQMEPLEQETHHQLVHHKEIMGDKVLEQEQMEAEEEVELEQ